MVVKKKIDLRRRMVLVEVAGENIADVGIGEYLWDDQREKHST